MGRVIVTDDESDMRMALRLFLERYGHEVEEAESGEQAVARIREKNNFDLALLDMRMPGLDGVQTLAQIRETHAQLPVIMVTGFGSVGSADAAMDKGANSYISKPFKHEELIEAITKAGLSMDRPLVAQQSILWNALMMALGLLVIGGAISAWGWQQGWWTNHDYKLPYSNPIDMSAAKDGKLYIGDWLTQTIYVHDSASANFTTTKTYFMPDIHLSGMAVCGNQIYTSDSWAHTIQRHKMDDTLTITSTFKSPGGAPTSLYCDDKYLWSVDSAGKIFQQRLDENLTLVAEYKTPGTSPVGFYKDDQYAWTSDAQTRRLYRLRLDSHLTVLGAYSLEDMEKGNEPLACFRWIGKDLWYARDRKPMLYRRRGAQLKSMTL